MIVVFLTLVQIWFFWPEFPVWKTKNYNSDPYNTKWEWIFSCNTHSCFCNFHLEITTKIQKAWHSKGVDEVTLYHLWIRNMWIRQHKCWFISNLARINVIPSNVCKGILNPKTCFQIGWNIVRCHWHYISCCVPRQIFFFLMSRFSPHVVMWSDMMTCSAINTNLSKKILQCFS
jgi:hypothetical protein